MLISSFVDLFSLFFFSFPTVWPLLLSLRLHSIFLFLIDLHAHSHFCRFVWPLLFSLFQFSCFLLLLFPFPSLFLLFLPIPLNGLSATDVVWYGNKRHFLPCRCSAALWLIDAFCLGKHEFFTSVVPASWIEMPSASQTLCRDAPGKEGRSLAAPQGIYARQ